MLQTAERIAAMAVQDEPVSSDFIRDIIKADLDAGKTHHSPGAYQVPSGAQRIPAYRTR